MSEVSEQVLIETQSWESYCGDGCCYDWGTRLFVNGEELPVSNDIDVDAILSVLKALGIEVVHEWRDDESFDARPEIDEDYEDETEESE